MNRPLNTSTTIRLAGAIALAGLAWAGVPVAAPAQGPAGAADGAALFAQNCSACHQDHGQGVPGAFPALAGDAFVQGPAPQVASLLIKGRGGMPSFANDLNDQQIAAVLTHVRSSWGNHAPAITPDVVAASRKGGPKEEPSVLPYH